MPGWEEDLRDEGAAGGGGDESAVGGDRAGGGGGGGGGVEAGAGGREEPVEVLGYRVVGCGAGEAQEVCVGVEFVSW